MCKKTLENNNKDTLARPNKANKAFAMCKILWKQKEEAPEIQAQFFPSVRNKAFQKVSKQKVSQKYAKICLN